MEYTATKLIVGIHVVQQLEQNDSRNGDYDYEPTPESVPSKHRSATEGKHTPGSTLYYYDSVSAQNMVAIDHNSISTDEVNTIHTVPAH